jgi:hypothetical protein
MRSTGKTALKIGLGIDDASGAARRRLERVGLLRRDGTGRLQAAGPPES